MEDKYNSCLDNLKVNEILCKYYDKLPYGDNTSVDDLQNRYDKCAEVLDNITMREVNLLWNLRHLPSSYRSLFFDLIQNNYDLYKNQSGFANTIDIIKHGISKNDDNRVEDHSKTN